MDNDDGQNDLPMDGGNDYGDEGGYDPNQDGDGMMDGDNNGGDGNGAGEDGDVDQYFDDAGDVGYLPADHVRTQSIYIMCTAPDGQTPKRPHEAVD